MRVDVKANELHGVKVSAISLVKRGANRIPFRFTKGAEAMPFDLQTLFRKRDDAAEAAALEEAKKNGTLTKAEKMAAAKALLEKSGFKVLKEEDKAQDDEDEDEKKDKASDKEDEDEVEKSDKAKKAEEDPKADDEDEEKKKPDEDEEVEKTAKSKKAKKAEGDTPDDEDEEKKKKKPDEEEDVEKSVSDLLKSLEKRLPEALVKATKPLSDQLSKLQSDLTSLTDRVGKAEDAVKKADDTLAGLTPGRPAKDLEKTVKSDTSNHIPLLDTAFMRAG